MIKFDYCISLPELQQYTDENLYQMLKLAERDKNEIFRATCTYWMCIMETDRRNGDRWPEYLDVKCISNIFNESHDIIFRLGNHYVLYEIENGVLAYNDKWIPYIFSIIDGDNRCAWKYFGSWKDSIENKINN